jgi:hypothetical protein
VGLKSIHKWGAGIAAQASKSFAIRIRVALWDMPCRTR